jgi:hypothetical protein
MYQRRLAFFIPISHQPGPIQKYDSENKIIFFLYEFVTNSSSLTF